ncbi:hypothetical protein EDC04DRAFT_566366 [Pisolithus marmoratus]|nr:hypothetical protein EDC04DRAFT_566366 [Pisolithus marmoratus]
MGSAYCPAERTISSPIPCDDHVRTFVRMGIHPRLDLRRPIAYSLPTSRDVALLLKVLSTRANNKFLVTTVVQCSAYCATDSLLEWITKVDSDGGEHLENSASTDSQSITVLCSVAKPQAWERDTADREQREQFKIIREKFTVLLNSRLLVTTEDGSSTVDDDNATEDALHFFSNIFGIKHLENYVGDMTFFKMLGSTPERKSGDESPSAAEDTLGQEPLSPERPSRFTWDDRNELEITQDPRIETLTTNLLKLIRTHGTPIKSYHKRKIKRKAVSISKTLGFRV